LAVRYPDGSIYVVDRERDAVKSGGEWIPTGVLESILSEHSAVKAAVVLARPDEKRGERPIAVIVPSVLQQLDTNESHKHEDLEKTLRAYVQTLVKQGRLSSFWVPDAYVFLEKLPMTSAGKIHKNALKQQLGLKDRVVVLPMFFTIFMRNLQNLNINIDHIHIPLMVQYKCFPLISLKERGSMYVQEVDMQD